MSLGQLRCSNTTAPKALWCAAMRAVSASSRAEGPFDPLATRLRPPSSDVRSSNSGSSAAAEAAA
eukprot:8453820-Heterocapsa_arctica.AAC.1